MMTEVTAMAKSLGENELKEIMKDPQKIRALAEDLRAQADRLEAAAAGRGPDVEGMESRDCGLGCIYGGSPAID